MCVYKNKAKQNIFKFTDKRKHKPEDKCLRSLSPTSKKLFSLRLDMESARNDFKQLVHKHNEEAALLEHVYKQIQKTDKDIEDFSSGRSISKDQ